MPEIGTLGLMSGDGKRSAGHRPQATAPILDSTDAEEFVAVQRFLPQLGVQRKGLAQLSFVCPFAKISSKRIRRRPSAWLRPAA